MRRKKYRYNRRAAAVVKAYAGPPPLTEDYTFLQLPPVPADEGEPLLILDREPTCVVSGDADDNEEKRDIPQPDAELEVKLELEQTRSTSKESVAGHNTFVAYMREATKTPLLSLAEEREWAIRKMKGDLEAREMLIKANLRFVVKIAKNYEDYGLPILDLINEGNIGLMEAIERYNPNKGAKVSTYAAWWIKQRIRRALGLQSRTVRLPAHTIEKISRMRSIANKLLDTFGREPTDAELAEEMGISEARVSSLRTCGIKPLTLDQQMGDDGDGLTFGDMLEDENAPTAAEILVESTTHNLVREMLKDLDSREAAILTYRFGLDGDKEMTLAQVGEKFNVTRERIRQIQNKAFDILKLRITKRERVQR